jgi:hypothetical protein
VRRQHVPGYDPLTFPDFSISGSEVRFRPYPPAAWPRRLADEDYGDRRNHRGNQSRAVSRSDEFIPLRLALEAAIHDGNNGKKTIDKLLFLQ